MSDDLVGQRIARYVERARDGRTVDAAARSAVRHAAERLPVGTVPAASREEIDAVVGVTRTLGAERLAAADRLVPRLDAAALRGLLP